MLDISLPWYSATSIPSHPFLLHSSPSLWCKSKYGSSISCMYVIFMVYDIHFHIVYWCEAFKHLLSLLWIFVSPIRDIPSLLFTISWYYFVKYCSFPAKDRSPTVLTSFAGILINIMDARSWPAILSSVIKIISYKYISTEMICYPFTAKKKLHLIRASYRNFFTFLFYPSYS